jgi:hypothetical protein
MMLRDSRDDKIREAELEVKKWKASEAVEEAESRLKHKNLVGAVWIGRQCLDMTPSVQWKKANKKERRKLVQKKSERLRKMIYRQKRAEGMQQQGAWIRWEGTQGRRVTSQDIWKLEGNHLEFLLKAVYHVLPSTTNLNTFWKPNPTNFVKEEAA